MSEKSKRNTNTLPDHDARKFRLQILNIYAAGEVAWEAAGYAAGEAPGEAAGYAAGDAAGEAAGKVARDAAGEPAMVAAGIAAWDAAGYAAWAAAGYAAWAARGAARAAAWDAAEKGGTTQQVAYDSCRSVINDREKIFKAINDLGDEIPSTPMTTEEVAQMCTTMMTFNEERFALLQLTIPLKMLDYLLGYERAIFFLRYCDNRYTFLMKKYDELILRLGLTDSHNKLFAPCISVSQLMSYLPCTVHMPIVLVKIIVEYCGLRQDNSEDVDIIYDRLLTLD